MAIKQGPVRGPPAQSELAAEPILREGFYVHDAKENTSVFCRREMAVGYEVADRKLLDAPGKGIQTTGDVVNQALAGSSAAF